MRRSLFMAFIIFIIWYLQCLPKVMFNNPTSTVLLDKEGELLGARIASDGQWRFYGGDSVPLKFETCILQFEDRRFYDHLGVSIRGIGRALVQNIKNRRIVSGGSTITMQVARIARKNPSRTIPEKLIEICMATRLEIRYSKKEILELYAANAPFGNNVVGLEAASWRYFGRAPSKLSWAESATLAVLPNAPGLIYPGRNQTRLLQKRNRLLKYLHETGVMDDITYLLSLDEPLPRKPLPLPQVAPHLLNRMIKEGFAGKTVWSTLDISLQKQLNEVLEKNMQNLRDNKIFNGAILVSSVKTGDVCAYIGNTSGDSSSENAQQVDCISAGRSSGSILKPFLYVMAMEDGLINPDMLLVDIPSRFGGFSPKNFDYRYDGCVPASRALSRSLNIPFVRMLNEYGYEKFHDELKKTGFSTLNKPASHYGLSLILGGAEVSLWDLNKAYNGMAGELANNKSNCISLFKGHKNTNELKAINKGCIYKTFEAMVELNRPDDDGNWKAFDGSRKIAWKTGTSFGFRDAWAVGLTKDYVVSVWVGNADGEGRPGLTGIKAAAPLMFDVFRQLPKSATWFNVPFTEMSHVKICRNSGYRAGEFCNETVSIEIPATCLKSSVCPYHKRIQLNAKGLKRVNADCMNPFDIRHENWFVLAPAIEKYYKQNHPEYRILPEFESDCSGKENDKPIAMIYPKPKSKIYVPLEIGGNRGRTIFEATHRSNSITIYWHLDDEYLGETKDIHQMALNPAIGKHVLLLQDENGTSLRVLFEISGKN